MSMQEEYESIVSDLSPYADYSFANLIIWLDLNDDLEICLLNNNVIIKYHDILQDSLPHVVSIVGKTKILDSLKQIDDYLIDSGEPRVLYAVPEEIAIEAAKIYRVEEERDSFDYILKVDEQVELAGTRFGKYRRKVNKLINNGEISLSSKEIPLESPEGRREIEEALSLWDQDMHQFTNNDPRRTESLAIKRTLEYAEAFGFRSVGIYIDNQLEAFTLFRIDKSRSVANINHTKTPYRMPFVFDYAVHATAKILQHENIQLINFEQDLGIPGLREHKLGLRPIKFLKKYTVYLEGKLSR